MRSNLIQAAARLRARAGALEAAVSAAVSASARRGAGIARELAPVDSGELRGGISAREGGLQAEVQSAAGHSAMVEYGTSRAPAQPFMMPMARRMQDEFPAEVHAALQEVLR